MAKKGDQGGRHKGKKKQAYPREKMENGMKEPCLEGEEEEGKNDRENPISKENRNRGKGVNQVGVRKRGGSLPGGETGGGFERGERNRGKRKEKHNGRGEKRGENQESI